MFKGGFIVLLFCFTINSDWPKPMIQQLFEINETNAFSFVEQFLKISKPKFKIYLAKPKPKPTTKPKKTKNFIIPKPEIWRNQSTWL